MPQTRFITPILFALAATAAAAEVAFQNGSFEQGTGGYWINRPAAVRVDSTDSTDGMQCIAITPPEPLSSLEKSGLGNGFPPFHFAPLPSHMPQIA